MQCHKRFYESVKRFTGYFVYFGHWMMMMTMTTVISGIIITIIIISSSSSSSRSGSAQHFGCCLRVRAVGKYLVCETRQTKLFFITHNTRFYSVNSVHRKLYDNQQWKPLKIKWETVTAMSIIRWSWCTYFTAMSSYSLQALGNILKSELNWICMLWIWRILKRQVATSILRR